MKKFLLIISAFLIIFSIGAENSFAEKETETTKEDPNGVTGSSGCLNESALDSKAVGDLIENCMPKKVVQVKDASVEKGFKEKILGFIKTISYILGLCAIGAIVFGGFKLVLNSGEDEKVTKAKEIIKRAIIGFLGIVSASGLIGILVNIIFGVTSIG